MNALEEESGGLMDGSDPDLLAMLAGQVPELTQVLIQAAQSASQAAQAAATVNVAQAHGRRLGD